MAGEIEDFFVEVESGQFVATCSDFPDIVIEADSFDAAAAALAVQIRDRLAAGAGVKAARIEYIVPVPTQNGAGKN